jgi:hypothetical protein
MWRKENWKARIKVKLYLKGEGKATCLLTPFLSRLSVMVDLEAL